MAATTVGVSPAAEAKPKTTKMEIDHTCFLCGRPNLPRLDYDYMDCSGFPRITHMPVLGVVCMSRNPSTLGLSILSKAT